MWSINSHCHTCTPAASLWSTSILLHVGSPVSSNTESTTMYNESIGTALCSNSLCDLLDNIPNSQRPNSQYQVIHNRYRTSLPMWVPVTHLSSVTRTVPSQSQQRTDTDSWIQIQCREVDRCYSCDDHSFTHSLRNTAESASILLSLQFPCQLSLASHNLHRELYNSFTPLHYCRRHQYYWAYRSRVSCTYSCDDHIITTLHSVLLMILPNSRLPHCQYHCSVHSPFAPRDMPRKAVRSTTHLSSVTVADWHDLTPRVFRG